MGWALQTCGFTSCSLCHWSVLLPDSLLPQHVTRHWEVLEDRIKIAETARSGFVSPYWWIWKSVLCTFLAAALALTRPARVSAGSRGKRPLRGGARAAPGKPRPPRRLPDPPPLLHPHPESRALLPSRPAHPPGVPLLVLPYAAPRFTLSGVSPHCEIRACTR